MQRFPRLGSINLALIALALTFHLLAISYNRWRVTTCKTCSSTDLYREWSTSLTERCYYGSVAEILFANENISNVSVDPFYADICLSNQFLFPQKLEYIEQCLQAMQIGPHTVCSAGLYDHNLCVCDYTSVTKAVLALSIISSIILGCMLIASHFTSYISDDFVLKWLLPSGFISLIFALICMFAILILTGVHKYDDAEVFVAWTLIKTSNASVINAFDDVTLWKTLATQNYDVTLGWCFGLEVVAAYFTLIAAIVYILMFLAKKRPESDGEEEE